MSDQLVVSMISNGFLVTTGLGGPFGNPPDAHYCATREDVLKHLKVALADLHARPRPEPADVTGIGTLAKEIGVPAKKVRRGMKKAFEAMDEGEKWKPGD